MIKNLFFGKKKNNETETKYASFFMRMLASIIDTLLCSIFLTPIFLFFNKIFNIKNLSSIDPNSIEINSWDETSEILMQSMQSFLFQVSVLTLALLIFWFYKSATPGKMLLKMKIVDAKTGNNLTKSQSIIRYISYIISTAPLCLGFIWIYFDKKRQGFHDKIAGTVVIHTGPFIKRENDET